MRKRLVMSPSCRQEANTGGERAAATLPSWLAWSFQEISLQQDVNPKTSSRSGQILHVAPLRSVYVTCASCALSSTDREQPVDVAGLLLAVSPHTRHRLLVIGRVPVRIKHDEAISTDQIQATSTSLAAQHEDELWTLRKQMESDVVQLLFDLYFFLKLSVVWNKVVPLTDGLLNLSTILALFLMDIVPSRRP